MKKIMYVFLLLVGVVVSNTLILSKMSNETIDKETVITLGYGNSKDLPINGETGC